MAFAEGIKNRENVYDHELKEILDKLLRVANEMQKERPKLHSLYVHWITTSEETIRSILEIRKKILEHNINTNAVSISGTSIAIVGSIMGLIGAAMAVPTAGLSLLLTLGGASTTAIGGSLSTGSLVARRFLSKSLCDDAKEIFHQCAKVTEALEEQREIYFGLINEFKKEIDEFGDNDFVALCSQLEEFDGDGILNDLQLDDDTKAKLPPSSTEVNKFKPLGGQQRKRLLEKLPELLKLVRDDPMLSGIMTNVFKSAAGNLSPGLDWSKALAKSFAIQSIAESGVGVLGAVFKSGKTLKDLFKGISTTARVGLGVLNAVFMIWGIVDLVITSIDVHKGSLSNESEELLKLADDMKMYREEVIRIMEEVFGWRI